MSAVGTIKVLADPRVSLAKLHPRVDALGVSHARERDELHAAVDSLNDADTRTAIAFVVALREGRGGMAGYGLLPENCELVNTGRREPLGPIRHFEFLVWTSEERVGHGRFWSRGYF